MSNDNRKPTIAIIGGGFSGIFSAIRVKKELGIQPHIFEGSKDFGGTWHLNTYPGCACDVPSHLYSLSTDLNPYWSKKYSPQSEIHDYMRGLVDKYDLRSNATTNCEVVKATWLDDERRWKLDYRNRLDPEHELQTVYYDVVFVAIGSIRVPKVPEQFKAFEGTVVHTAMWDSSIDFTGKKVAVIGSGASAVQAVPELSKVASKLHNYQRTAIWCRPRGQYAYSALTKFLFRWCPLLMKLYRLKFYLIVSRQSLIARMVSRSLVNAMKKRILKQGRPDLVKKLIPDYAAGCKRIAVTDDYLEALCRDNVVVEKSSITEVHGRTIVTADGNKEEYDILVLATGYDVQGFLGNLTVQGKHKQTLNDSWQDAFPEMYKTTCINGYPNMFIILGPSSILGHNSVLTMTETQVNYIVQGLKLMVKENLVAFDPTKKAQDKFVAQLKDDLENTVWKKGGCNSWYVNKEGDVTANWSSTVTRFWIKLRKFKNFDDFNIYKE
ncbi:flavin-binding monooxygenase-like protein [Zychaea mexicana]|uniref:flavin-binding monooxygenase-like protein n=1 Tax=Zychaea mexicana TaxID=64656 RepID=UPI0022FE5857|nr:flavin-binding monooxygenase-like protein [Zychaea mexicana]KAI9498576.1 flavin-binding monooxygenase-like protein [Zychaea mexicana]